MDAFPKGDDVSVVNPQWLIDVDAYIKESPRKDDCHPDYRFRAVLPSGFVKFYPTRERAREAIAELAPRMTMVFPTDWRPLIASLDSKGNYKEGV
jgi:hypothetical protein